METKSIKDIVGLLHRKPALVLGPAATTYLTAYDEILKRTIKSLGKSFDQNILTYNELIDILKTTDLDLAEKARITILDEIKRLTPSLDIEKLIHVRWSSIISLTPDLLFEGALQEHYDQKASSWTTTIVDSPTTVPKIHTIPIFKLLGNHQNPNTENTLALGMSDLLMRERSWEGMLSPFNDYLKNGALFFVGTETCIPFTQKLLSILFSGRPPFPSQLIFLRGDSTPLNPTIASLVDRKAETVIVDSTLKEFCGAIADIEERDNLNAMPNLSIYDAESQCWITQLKDFRHIIDIVPNQLPTNYNPNAHKKPLTDSLFRPASLDWYPYLSDMDLIRSDGSKLEAAINSATISASGDKIPSIILRGEAGVGKSTTLKRSAINLSKQGKIVLWCRRSPIEGAHRGFKGLATRLRELNQKIDVDKRKDIILICDDSWLLRISPHELFTAFESSNSTVILVFSFRNSDYLVHEGAGFPLPTIPTEDIELNYELDQEELTELPNLLVRAGAASDINDAARAIREIPTKSSTDILCSLWYLVPNTRSQISSSLQDEYCRLGGASAPIEAYANAASSNSDAARLAYEFVTVCSSLGIGLPIEVLVHALAIDYDIWIDMCQEGRPLWGLLYDEVDDENENIVYRTRNDVVTKVLLNLVNQGVGHAGEFRVLKILISACDIATQPYRAFIFDLLVRSRGRLEKILSFPQGEELYKLAISTFPDSDRSLQHHYGIWIRDVGKDATKAYEQLETALNSSDYRYASVEEPKEYIHTSMAAAVVSKVKDGTQDIESGLDVVREHLRQASNPSYFNPHTTHVFANLLLELSKRSESRHSGRLTVEPLADAMQAVERALQIIGASGHKKLRYSKAITMLNDMQQRCVSSIQDIDELKTYAEQWFIETGNSVGFEVVARRLLIDASQSDKGKDYNLVNDYIINAIKLIQNNGSSPNARLLSVRVDLIVRWRLQHAKGAIDWGEMISDLETILESPWYRDDIIKLYYYSVALYQIGEYTKGEAIFSKLRRIVSNSMMKDELRNYLTGKEGFPRRLQGTLKRQNGRLYVFSPELGIDLYARGKPENAGDGATVHFYLGFSLTGPKAVFKTSHPDDLLLP